MKALFLVILLCISQFLFAQNNFKRADTIALEFYMSKDTSIGLTETIKSQLEKYIRTDTGTGKAFVVRSSKTISSRQIVKWLAAVKKQNTLRVGLSTPDSVYAAEAEKKLDWVFKKAASQNAILFFEEADALFGKKTTVSDSHDRYANQEISYLLKRIESFKGIVIFDCNSEECIKYARKKGLKPVQ